jgi:hypothetical protein
MASMQIGLTKKLQPQEVRQYKATWEARCHEDMLALARDRENFYVALYKNPPRIRELFSALSTTERKGAVERLGKNIIEEESEKSRDAGFQFQQLPRKNEITLACLASAANGEIWPVWCPRVKGHPKDPDYPDDFAPPNGMKAFHWFDLYYQMLVRVLAAAKPPIPLEYLQQFSDVSSLNTFAGALVNFRERSYGKGIQIPGAWQQNPTGSIQFRKKIKGILFRTKMELRTMYVFSDTSAMNLQSSRICGIGLFGGASLETKSEIWLRVVPLLIGLGGFGQSDASGWGWNLK